MKHKHTFTPHFQNELKRTSLTEAYRLRDELRKKYIRRVKKGLPFPRRAQHLLDSVEWLIASQERAEALKTGVFSGDSKRLNSSRSL